MIKVEYLADYPEHVKVVAGWIYNEWSNKAIKNLDDVVIRIERKCVKDRVPLVLVAVDGKKCVGTVTIYKNDLKTREDLSPWLGSLYVDESCRGQGIGEKLVSKVIEISRQFGLKKIYLRTEDKADYYAKRGWDFVFETQDEKGKQTKVFEYKM